MKKKIIRRIFLIFWITLNNLSNSAGSIEIIPRSQKKLKKIENYSNVIEIRGTGLLIGIDVTSSAFAKNTITPEMRKRGINILPEGRVLMFSPAYIVSEEQIDHFVNILSEVLHNAK